MKYIWNVRGMDRNVSMGAWNRLPAQIQQNSVDTGTPASSWGKSFNISMSSSNIIEASSLGLASKIWSFFIHLWPSYELVNKNLPQNSLLDLPLAILFLCFLPNRLGIQSSSWQGSSPSWWCYWFQGTAVVGLFWGGVKMSGTLFEFWLRQKCCHNVTWHFDEHFAFAKIKTT